jgi:hypothetical protein
LTVILQGAGDPSAWRLEDDDESGTTASDFSTATVLDLVHGMLKVYVAMTPHQYVAVALWILHTHVYQLFMVSPRLLLTSPVPGCGKTVLLKVIMRMVPRPFKTDDPTPAVIYRLIDEQHPTILFDEVDNAGLFVDRRMRKILNSGHECDGNASRVIDGQAKQFSTYGPMALAGIGHVPLPLSQRSIKIDMVRDDGTAPRKRFDKTDTEHLDIVYPKAWKWTRELQLNSDPPMPNGLRNRQADNWRPLIAIADTFGPHWGTTAREAAIAFSKGFGDEDIAVALLRDIRDIFSAGGVDRLSSEALVAALNDMEDSLWREFRGPRDDQPARKLSQSALADLLGRFHIISCSVWPLHRRPTDKSKKGYHRHQFEQAWRSYCDDADDADGTPAQRNNIKHLGSL